MPDLRSSAVTHHLNRSSTCIHLLQEGAMRRIGRRSHKDVLVAAFNVLRTGVQRRGIEEESQSVSRTRDCPTISPWQELYLSPKYDTSRAVFCQDMSCSVCAMPFETMSRS